MDLEKLFDRASHGKPVPSIAGRAGGKRLSKLIRGCLESGIMTSGAEATAEGGAPQGGPPSPPLSNIMLDELDKELERRGRKFVRHAGGCSIHVKSRRAGRRVHESMKAHLEAKLKLRANESESAAGKPERRKFPGFSFYRKRDGKPGIRMHPRSCQRLREKARRAASRNRGAGMECRLKESAEAANGWAGCFGMADGAGKLNELDGWMRRRLRACIWKQWKRAEAKFKSLQKLGASKEKAWEFANTRKGCWRISKSPILSAAAANQRLGKRGFKSLADRHQAVHSF
jgi:hypothetical protein